MNYFNKIKMATACLAVFSMTSAFANDSNSVEFFVSNNSNEINLQTAYARLIGDEQMKLENTMITILQENHIEQGQLEDILGTYQMSNDGNMTADNTEHFIASPYQSLPSDKAFALAKELAIKFNQDSVAVLIPNNSTVGDITVRFTSHQPTINEVASMVHEKLPALYSQAYSLHLKNGADNFDNVKVVEIEWLGSKISLKAIQDAFPSEKVDSRKGDVFLVYKNGQREQI